MTVLAAVAEFERDLISERVMEGLDNARRKGSHLGRPRVLSRPGFEEQWLKVRMLLVDQQIGKREAARRLKIGAGTLARLLESEPDLELLAAAEDALAGAVGARGVFRKPSPSESPLPEFARGLSGRCSETTPLEVAPGFGNGPAWSIRMLRSRIQHDWAEVALALLATRKQRRSRSFAELEQRCPDLVDLRRPDPLVGRQRLSQVGDAAGDVMGANEAPPDALQGPRFLQWRVHLLGQVQRALEVGDGLVAAGGIEQERTQAVECLRLGVPVADLFVEAQSFGWGRRHGRVLAGQVLHEAEVGECVRPTVPAAELAEAGKGFGQGGGGRGVLAGLALHEAEVVEGAGRAGDRERDSQ